MQKSGQMGPVVQRSKDQLSVADVAKNSNVGLVKLTCPEHLDEG